MVTEAKPGERARKSHRRKAKTLRRPGRGEPGGREESRPFSVFESASSKGGGRCGTACGASRRAHGLVGGSTNRQSDMP